MASLRSNVHPAAASDPLGTYGSPVPAYIGGGVGSSPNRSLFGSPITDAAVTSLTEGMSASDLSARARARGVLQSYARERQRVVELEAELGKSNNLLAQNDALIASLRREVHDTAFAHSEEVRSLQAGRAEVDRQVAALEQELEDASAGFSRKLSEVMAQNRVKEQEVVHFETQLQRSNDDIKRLRAELGRQLGYDVDGNEVDVDGGSPSGKGGIRAKELEAAQQRAVSLAKKLIDAERGKREVEEALLEDRHHSQGALRTIESLRQQLAEAHTALSKEASARRGDEQYYRNALEQLRNESEKQRQGYQEALLSAGEQSLLGGTSNTPAVRRAHSPSNSSVITSADEGSGDGASMASLRARLRASGEQVSYLADQTDRRQQEIEVLSEALAKEKAGRTDDYSTLNAASREGKEEVRRVKRDLAGVKAERTAAMRMVNDLKALYERLLVPTAGDPLWSDEQLMVDVLYELRKIGHPLVIFEKEPSVESPIPPPPSNQPPQPPIASDSGGGASEEKLRREMATIKVYHRREVALLQEALKESQRGRVVNALERASGIVTTPTRRGGGSRLDSEVVTTPGGGGSDNGDALESEDSRVGGGSVTGDGREAKEWKDAFYHSEQVKRGLAQELSQVRAEAARMRTLLDGGGRHSHAVPHPYTDDDEMVEGSPMSSHYPSPSRAKRTLPSSPSLSLVSPGRSRSSDSQQTNHPHHNSPTGSGRLVLVPSRNQVSAATERLLAEETQSSLKDHIATLHRYILQLEQQAEADQEELERLRHRYHLLETHQDTKLVQTKKEHAMEVQGLLRSLTEIRAEYADMMKRRQHLFAPTHNPEVDFSQDKHQYYHGTTTSSSGNHNNSHHTTGAEVALERRLDALIHSNERRLSSAHRGTTTPTTTTTRPVSAAPTASTLPPARSASPPTHFITPTGLPASRTNSVSGNNSAYGSTYPAHHNRSSSTASGVNGGGYFMRSP